jgi:Lon protease-like protein
VTDIARLFAEDPLRLTAADFVEDWQKQDNGRKPLDAIIAYYREARKNFNNGEKAAGSTKKLKDASAPKAKVTALDLDKLLG